MKPRVLVERRGTIPSHLLFDVDDSSFVLHNTAKWCRLSTKSSTL
jgi:hypothetical protein